MFLFAGEGGVGVRGEVVIVEDERGLLAGVAGGARGHGGEAPVGLGVECIGEEFLVDGEGEGDGLAESREGVAPLAFFEDAERGVLLGDAREAGAGGEAASAATLLFCGGRGGPRRARFPGGLGVAVPLGLDRANAEGVALWRGGHGRCFFFFFGGRGLMCLSPEVRLDNVAGAAVAQVGVFRIGKS